MRLRFLAIGALLAAVACVSVNKSVLTQRFLTHPVPRDDVQVYFADDSIPPHTRVAILNAEGDETFTNEGQMLDKLREEAGKLGANAIVLREMKDPSTGERIVAGIFGGTATRDSEAIAIYAPSLDQRPEESRPPGRE